MGKSLLTMVVVMLVGGIDYSLSCGRVVKEVGDGVEGGIERRRPLLFFWSSSTCAP